MGSCCSKKKAGHRPTTKAHSRYSRVEDVPDLARPYFGFDFYDDKGEITEECNGLKQNLVVAQKEREAAQEEVSHLNFRVQSLENLVKDLQEAADKVGQLENEKEEAVQQLEETQGQVDFLQQNHQAVESEHENVVQTLRQQVKELEDRRQREEERGEGLAKEVARLQKEAEARLLSLRDSPDALGNPPDRTDSKEAVDQETFVAASTAPVHSSPVKSSGLPTQSRSLLHAGRPPVRAHVPARTSRPVEDPELNELSLKLNSLLDEISECGSVEGNPEEGLEEKQESMDLKHTGRPGEGSESFLSAWAQKGPIQVYIAKYSYDPFEYSPNENPEAELPLSAGDYVLVVGEMDEDGFFDGELIDGRQGLVPSNFIEKVEDEDLADFHTALMEAGHGELSTSNGHSNLSTSRPLQTGNNNNDNNNSNSNNNNNTMAMDLNRAGVATKQNISNGGQMMDDSNSDLEDIAEMDEDSVSVNSRVLANGANSSVFPPCPRSLSVDRQLNTSLMVSWKGPEVAPGLEVHAYHVLVDGQLKTSVKASERTKAHLEGVDASKVHRICVQCLSNRGQSKDGQCTMLVGKDVYPQPSDLRVNHLSPMSASLSWLPGNSNYQHSIMVNGKEMRLVKPGVFRHTLTGLSPGTKHKVTLIAKSISGTLNEEKSKRWMEYVSVYTEFTTPEAGSPEPPLNVQTERGPKERSLLLTWLPVTINASGVSNGTVVSGYQVVASGRQIKTVSGATADHVVLDSSDFQGKVPAELTLRTISSDGIESVDSDPVLIPLALIQEVSGERHVSPHEMGAGVGGAVKPTKSASMEDQKGHDTDEEIEAAFREVQHSPCGVDADMASETYSDTSSSELSDIPEVEEELLGSNDSNLNHLGEPIINELPPSHQVAAESPKPTPRKNMAADSGTKEFTSQKPDSSKLLMAPARVVPAIEITRDSSSDRGASLDEETDRDSLSSTRNTTPTQRSAENSIASQYRSNNRNPSAFRQVDQTKHRDGKDKMARVNELPQSQVINEEQTESASTSTANPNSRSHPSWNNSSSSSVPEVQAQGSRNQSPDHRKNQTSSSHPDGTLDAGGDTDSISGEINSVVDENTVRLFIALFDYDPTTMSPNVDSIDEELPFREGQILKVYGDKDVDGFYRGESQGRRGFIPCNMVSEVQIDDPDLVDQLLKESMGKAANNYNASAQTPTNETYEDPQAPPVRMPTGMRPGPMRRMVAMYDYDPQELSPNVDAELELSFKTGHFILVYGDMDEDGFFSGELNGQHGLVPSNFLQPAPLSDEDGLESASVLSATPRSRSGESLETSANAFGKAEAPSNLSQVNEESSPSPQNRALAKSTSPSELRASDSDHQNDSTSITLPVEEEKPKKKTGFFNRSKNIFKKLTR